MNEIPVSEFLSLIDGQKEAVFVKDLDGRYTYINSTGAAMLGRTIEEVIGRDDTEFFEPLSARAMRERDFGVLSAKEPAVYKSKAIRSMGDTRYYESSKKPLYDKQGCLTGLLGLSRDVTSLLEFQERHDLESISLQEVRSLFEKCLAQVSHDLKGPLTSLSLRLQLLEKLAANLKESADPTTERVSAERLRFLASGSRVNERQMTEMIDGLVLHYRAELGLGTGQSLS